MPWLSRQNSSDSSNSDDTFAIMKPTAARNMVSFIPAQIDGLCGTSTSSQKNTPVQIVMNDLRILMQNISCVPHMARRLYREKIWLRYRNNWSILKNALLQICLLTTQLWAFCAIIPALILLPGLGFAIVAVGFWAITTALSFNLNRRKIITVKRSSAPMTESLLDERWFFINGPMTSDSSLQLHCERLSHTFSRSVTGIHNSTYGAVIDFLSTMFLRSANYPTSCTRILTSQLRDACLNNSIRKVIVLAHSTGALHVSLALDVLHADLPVDVLSKLEIYTFGATATHLNNPLIRLESLQSTFNPTETTQAAFTRADGTIKSPVKATLASLGHRIEDHERVIPHIEHYALQNDFSARWGILHSVRNVLDGRYCGRVFVLNSNKEIQGRNGDGFLFQEHYMDTLFPLNSRSPVLDQLVSVDVSTAEKREFTAMGIALPMKSIVRPVHRESLDGIMMGVTIPASPDSSPKTNGRGGKRTTRGKLAKTSEKRSSWGTAGALGIDGVGKAISGARECQGRTVRQLSRLWRYAQGGRPVGEGIPVTNGIGIVNGHGTM